VSEGTYGGSGYTLKHRVSSSESKPGALILTTYTSVLTTEDGKQTTLTQTVAPADSYAIPPPPTSHSGDILGASYIWPFGTGLTSYVILDMPREFVTTVEERKVVGRDCQIASPNNPVPCGLRGRVVAYRLEVNGTATFQNGNTKKSGSRRTGKIVFGDNDDVYLFLPVVNDQHVGSEGFAYKLNLEIDFAANPSRAPKDFIIHYKSYKGRMEFKNGSILISDVSEDEVGITRSELMITFDPHFDSCSVTGFSYVFDSTYPMAIFKHATLGLAKQTDCQMYNAN
jgi:hypothetical protein